VLYVDTHPHILALDTQKYPVAPLGGVQSEWSKSFSNSAEEFLRHMDEAGVGKATLVATTTATSPMWWQSTRIASSALPVWTHVQTTRRQR
jgi:hypothetical protein